MLAVIGVLMALVERSRSGKGQIIEVDMVRPPLLATPWHKIHKLTAFVGHRYPLCLDFRFLDGPPLPWDANVG